MSRKLAARDVEIWRGEGEFGKFKSGRDGAADEGKRAVGSGGLPVVWRHENLRGLVREHVGAKAVVNGGALGGFGDGKC
ncbi:hypothetical protein RC74_15055 [Falsihalocynthiibacter arcticus]|uniref:Uncharacterized protein n=1 Tax=Falsihalocynthiibacter arcticus TaxID=1579316 RepID=A0A126V2A4_9RHOB|nr:hypothetical protein RC74_15055 [Falsihalocynthiibacter arcticus]